MTAAEIALRAIRKSAGDMSGFMAKSAAAPLALPVAKGAITMAPKVIGGVKTFVPAASGWGSKLWGAGKALLNNPLTYFAGGYGTARALGGEGGGADSSTQPPPASTTPEPTSESTSDTKSAPNPGLFARSKEWVGANPGVAMGIGAGALGMGGIGMYLWHQRRKRQQEEEEERAARRMLMRTR